MFDGSMSMDITKRVSEEGKNEGRDRQREHTLSGIEAQAVDSERDKVVGVLGEALLNVSRVRREANRTIGNGRVRIEG